MENPVDKDLLALKFHSDRTVPLIFYPSRESESAGKVPCPVAKAHALNLSREPVMVSYFHFFDRRLPVPFSIGEIFLYIRKVIRQSISPFIKVKGTLKMRRHFSMESAEGMMA